MAPQWEFAKKYLPDEQVEFGGVVYTAQGACSGVEPPKWPWEVVSAAAAAVTSAAPAPVDAARTPARSSGLFARVRAGIHRLLH